MQSSDDVAVVILAGGRGSRMRATVPKILHEVAGWPMVRHVIQAAAEIQPTTTTIVVPPELENHPALRGVDGLEVVVRPFPRGTGDAAFAGVSAIGSPKWVVVLPADHPLITGRMLAELVAAAQESEALVTLMTCIVSDDLGDRVQRDAEGRVVEIVSYKDDDPAHRHGPVEVNTGILVLDYSWAHQALAGLKSDEVTGEVYLIDLVGMAHAERRADGHAPVAALVGPPEASIGVDSREQLADANETAWQMNRRRVMRAGVTLIGLQSIVIDQDVQIGPETTIFPFTRIGPGSRIGARCIVGPHVNLEQAIVPDDTRVGALADVRWSRAGDSKEDADNMVTGEQRPLTVFLCHASQDKEHVRGLYKKLLEDQVLPWLDEEDILPGEEWDMAIRRAVNDSDVVLVCLSGRSVSKEGYVQKEIRQALEVADSKPEGTIFVIPLRLEPCDLPSRLSKWQRVDMFAPNGYERMMRALQARADHVGAVPRPISRSPSVGDSRSFDGDE